jgi:hypothetical protein
MIARRNRTTRSKRRWRRPLAGLLAASLVASFGAVVGLSSVAGASMYGQASVVPTETATVKVVVGHNFSLEFEAFFCTWTPTTGCVSTALPPYTWSLVSPPSWVTLSPINGGSDAQLKGTPTSTGTFTIQVDVSKDGAATQSVDAYVNVGIPPSVTASSTTETLEAGHAITPVTFAATGTPAPTLSETGAPTGVTLTTNTLSGTPTKSGKYTVDVTASNGFTPAATAMVTLYVEGPPGLTASATSETAKVGQAITPITFAETGYPSPTLTEC